MTENVQKTAWTEMDEEAESGKFWKPVEGKQNLITVISDPVVGMTNFKKSDQPQKKQFTFIVTVPEKPTEMTTWSVSSKPALRAIRKMMGANNIASLIGSTIQVVVSGEGFDRKYTIIPVALPTPETVAKAAQDFPQAAREKAFPDLFAPKIPPAPPQ
jgi:hypothetical protein